MFDEGLQPKLPTAQALVEVIAATPPNPEPAPEPVDAAYALPFQCSMSPPGFPALSSSPTAQTSLDELPATPDNSLFTDPNGGTATLLHDDPFHRSARGTLVEASIAVEPTAQPVLPAKVSDGVRGDARRGRRAVRWSRRGSRYRQGQHTADEERPARGIPTCDG